MPRELCGAPKNGNTMKAKLNFIILAAGKGTRLNLDIPKPLCPFRERTLISQLLHSFHQEFSQNPPNFVLGHQIEKMLSYLESESIAFNYVHQKEQLGTGHALQTYFDAYPELLSDDQYIHVVMCADTPLLQPEHIDRLQAHLVSNNLEAVLAAFNVHDPTGLGRIIESKKGLEIVEEKDANEHQREIKLVNSGLYLFKSSILRKRLKSLDSKNKSHEFYLTDVFSHDEHVGLVTFESSHPFLGVNNLNQLQEIEQIYNQEIINKHRLSGVMIESNDVFISDQTQIKSGTRIQKHVRLEGRCSIDHDCVIAQGVILKNCTLSKSVRVYPYSVCENASIGEKSDIGPFARLRPDSQIGDHVKVGNFVEVKKSKLSHGVKVSHLSYVGDAFIGKNSNIGCGFITCNYDGKSKHQTNIGDNVFIGSDCQMIAPVSIGNDAFVAAGSCITHDVEDEDFAIARTRQVIKKKLAHKFLKK